MQFIIQLDEWSAGLQSTKQEMVNSYVSRTAIVLGLSAVQNTEAK